jgi:hypothetical protein
MRKSRGISYLVALSLSLGLSAIVAIDILRRAPSGAPLAAHLKRTQSPSGADLQVKIPVAAAPPNGTAGGSAIQPALPSSAGAAPGSAKQAPSWPSATVEISTFAGRAAVPVPRESKAAAKTCAASWDKDTHMTKEEWSAACQRADHQPRINRTFVALQSSRPPRGLQLRPRPVTTRRPSWTNVHAECRFVRIGAVVAPVHKARDHPTNGRREYARHGVEAIHLKMPAITTSATPTWPRMRLGAATPSRQRISTNTPSTTFAS